MKKQIIITILIVFAVASCNDFLEPDLRSIHNYNNYFQSEEDLVNFANGMFGGLITWTWEGG